MGAFPVLSPLTVLPLLPPTPMPRRAAARPWRRPELRAGLPRVGRLDDLASAARGSCRAAALAARTRRGVRHRLGHASRLVDLALRPRAHLIQRRLARAGAASAVRLDLVPGGD